MASVNVLALLLFVVSIGAARAGFLRRTQSVAVVGRLFCRGNFTVSPVKVELFDRDVGTADDLMGRTESGQHGSFYVDGHEDELSNIDPEIRIHHSCPKQENTTHHRSGDDKSVAGHSGESIGEFHGGAEPRCFKMDVPDDYIASGKRASLIFDVGTIHLETTESNCKV